MVRNGVRKWLKPVYVKSVRHWLPDAGRYITVQAVTQYIDGFWRILRVVIRPWTRAIDLHILRRLARVAQFRYWNRGRDIYMASARAVKWKLQQM